MKLVRTLALLASTALASALSLASCMLTGCSRIEQAPAVSYTLLDGQRSDLATLRGHVVLVNFWATDCAPCVEEMPAMVANWRRFSPQGFETLAVAVQTDPPALVSNFAQARALPFGVVIDNTGEVARRFGNVQFTPTSLLINKRGEIVKRYVGEPDFDELHKLIEKLLAEA